MGGTSLLDFFFISLIFIWLAGLIDARALLPGTFLGDRYGLVTWFDSVIGLWCHGRC
ncbi:hypothetical protein V8F33_001762 [Rhypophila sp. PSN 637]